VHVHRAAELRRLLTGLGPSFAKVGQALSARPDLLPQVRTSGGGGGGKLWGGGQGQRSERRKAGEAQQVRGTVTAVRG
jgi:hypothetical protein